ncbi:hypothetical protein B0H13DRAFT_2370832 [Mycena leptocephala]|nr:hypothetical protein B0H13DRAFT_2370832 [Mycena leptocephala]
MPAPFHRIRLHPSSRPHAPETALCLHAHAPVRSGRAALTRPAPRRSTPPHRSLTRTTASPLDLNAPLLVDDEHHPPGLLASIPLLQTLNMNIFTHIRMCRWNPNALAHDIWRPWLVPPPSPFCDGMWVIV